MHSLCSVSFSALGNVNFVVAHLYFIFYFYFYYLRRTTERSKWHCEVSHARRATSHREYSCLRTTRCNVRRLVTDHGCAFDVPSCVSYRSRTADTTVVVVVLVEKSHEFHTVLSLTHVFAIAMHSGSKHSRLRTRQISLAYNENTMVLYTFF